MTGGAHVDFLGMGDGFGATSSYIVFSKTTSLMAAYHQGGYISDCETGLQPFQRERLFI